ACAPARRCAAARPSGARTTRPSCRGWPRSASCARTFRTASRWSARPTPSAPRSTARGSARRGSKSVELALPPPLDEQQAVVAEEHQAIHEAGRRAEHAARDGFVGGGFQPVLHIVVLYALADLRRVETCFAQHLADLVHVVEVAAFGPHRPVDRRM